MEGTLGSKATGEPSMLMGCSVLFAIRNAVQSARADCGIKGNVEEPNWVNLCKLNLLGRATQIIDAWCV
jgi:xanthine dehydrogenase molybdopterin-binding subunit B